MKIRSLQISNILSFKYYEDISLSPEITFDESLSIIIGENGSGKSTALEVLNFIFRRVLFKRFDFNEDSFLNRNQRAQRDWKDVIKPSNNSSISGYRLEPNWATEDHPQAIRLKLTLDDVDLANIGSLVKNYDRLKEVAKLYSETSFPMLSSTNHEYVINISLDRAQQNFTTTILPALEEPGFVYLSNYNHYKNLINLYNREHPDDRISPLFESFALIGGFRNYSSFNATVSLSSALPGVQIQDARNNDYVRSLNSAENSEPKVFGLVRLLVAEKHYELSDEKLDNSEREERANSLPFLKSINDRLQLVQLKCKIRLSDKQHWGYAFEFYDTLRDRVLTDINSLSAGQKAIIHLVFEAYGRGELKGGLVIIDEPELHLHHQFQDEYLRVIADINKQQQSQYVLVTHSEVLITSDTIEKVRRFTLDTDNYTQVKSPAVSADKKTLVKILDNTRSTFAFFARKVVLVEGDTDRYFLNAFIQEVYPDLSQQIAILDIGGKGSYEKWRSFFEDYGLSVSYIGDLDNVFSLPVAGTTIIPKAENETIRDALKQKKLDNLTVAQIRELQSAYTNLISDTTNVSSPKLSLWRPVIDRFNSNAAISSAEVSQEVLAHHTDLDKLIEAKYPEGIFILKKGELEDYIGTPHGDVGRVIEFCENELSHWLTTAAADEIRAIVDAIAGTSYKMKKTA
jgi:predicted ATPase